jgi:glycosyltransferase involved in cell wall biosynthesis
MGGVQFSTLYVIQQLVSPWEPVLVCSQEGDLTDACRRLDVPVHILKQPSLRSTSCSVGRNARFPNPFAWVWNLWVTLIATQRLARLLTEMNPHLIVTKGLFPHLYGGLAARRLGIPCVWHLQDFVSERFWGIYSAIFGSVARWLPNYIIVDGAAIRHQLPRSVRARTTVIHNGIDTRMFGPDLDGADVRRETGIPPGAIAIGNVARMTPWKGQHHLLEAFARIAQRFPHVYLLFVGAPVFDSDVYQRRLLDLTEKLGLTDRVKFAGYRMDIPQVLAAMDVFAFTSVEKDTSPLALLSAMSAGLPIAAFDIEGVREILKPEEQGLLSKVGDASALAQSLARLLSDEGLRRQLGTNARRRAEDEFTLDRYVSRMQEVFVRALSQGQCATSDQLLPAARPHGSRV